MRPTLRNSTHVGTGPRVAPRARAPLCEAYSSQVSVLRVDQGDGLGALASGMLPWYDAIHEGDRIRRAMMRRVVRVCVTAVGIAAVVAAVASGDGWRAQRLPSDVASNGGELYGVACPSVATCTAFGVYGQDLDQTLVIRSKGAKWSQQQAPAHRLCRAAQSRPPVWHVPRARPASGSAHTTTLPISRCRFAGRCGMADGGASRSCRTQRARCPWN